MEVKIGLTSNSKIIPCNLFNIYYINNIMDKNEAKAQAYNNLLFQHSRLEEQIRQIKAENFDLTKQDVEKIDKIRFQQQMLMAEVQKLF